MSVSWTTSIVCGKLPEDSVGSFPRVGSEVDLNITDAMRRSYRSRQEVDRVILELQDQLIEDHEAVRGFFSYKDLVSLVNRLRLQHPKLDHFSKKYIDNQSPVHIWLEERTRFGTNCFVSSVLPVQRKMESNDNGNSTITDSTVERSPASNGLFTALTRLFSISVASARNLSSIMATKTTHVGQS